MNKSSKMILIILLFIIAFFIGFLGAKIIVDKVYMDQNINIIISCRTKDKHNIKIDVLINFDNPSKRSEFHIKKATKESCMYIFSSYTLDETINLYEEIEALIQKDIYDRLQIQNKSFIIHKVEYVIKE